jgi:hypothetical protein
MRVSESFFGAQSPMTRHHRDSNAAVAGRTPELSEIGSIFPAQETVLMCRLSQRPASGLSFAITRVVVTSAVRWWSWRLRRTSDHPTLRYAPGRSSTADGLSPSKSMRATNLRDDRSSQECTGMLMSLLALPNTRHYYNVCYAEVFCRPSAMPHSKATEIEVKRYAGSRGVSIYAARRTLEQVPVNDFGPRRGKLLAGGVRNGRLSEPCCEYEMRNFNGGCDNCHDPCL